MKCIFEQYFNTMLLALAVIILSILFSFSLEKDSQTQFQSVLINEGDSLWSIANQYQVNTLTKTEFIDWIEEHNEVCADTLQPGQTIIIPIKRDLVQNLATSK